MSKGVNKCIILGNVGKDPSVRYMPNGGAVANLTVATSEQWKDQQGQKQEKTEWHRLVAYKKLAEIIGQYVHKGSKIYVEGKLQTKKWQDQSGQDRYTTEIVINQMQMLDSASKSNPNNTQNQQGNYTQSQSGFNQGKQNQQQGGFNQQPSPQQPTYNEPPSDFNDDMIPF